MILILAGNNYNFSLTHAFLCFSLFSKKVIISTLERVQSMGYFRQDPFSVHSVYTGFHYSQQIAPLKQARAPFLHTILSAKYWDADAKLVYYGYRYYSPGMGRWANRDPIGDVVGAQRRIERMRRLLADRGIVVSLDTAFIQRLLSMPNPLASVSDRGQHRFPLDLQSLLESQTAANGNINNLYRFCNNNTLMWVDPDGEWIVPTIVAAGAVVTLMIVLPDWDADALSNAQAAEVARLIQALKKCTPKASNADVGSNLDAMTVTGIFKTDEPDGENDESETRNGRFLGYGNRTILSENFFIRGDVESQLKTLLHESYHAGTEDWTENISYGYAEKAFQDMKCCLQEAGILK